MKNFKTPCAFYGTKPELDALIEPLKGLGYRIPLQFFKTKSNDLVLVTNDCGENGLIEIYPLNEGHLDENIKRISATASNIPLCLALAAMVDHSKIHDGEWVRDNQAKRPIYKAMNYVGRSVYECDIEVRKATVPEIFAHFGVPFEGEDKKEEVREIEGYKAPFDLWEGNIRKGTVYLKYEDGIYYPSYEDDHENYLLPAEIVETWEPVYKEEPKKIRVEAGEYTKEELQNLIERYEQKA